MSYRCMKMQISEVSFLFILIRISQLKDFKSFAIALDTLRSTLSSCPASFSSASSLSSTSVNDDYRSRDRDRSNGGVGVSHSHRATSTSTSTSSFSQGMTMSIVVLVASRQLQMASKVLSNMILFTGHLRLDCMHSYPFCSHHISFLPFLLSYFFTIFKLSYFLLFMRQDINSNTNN